MATPLEAPLTAYRIGDRRHSLTDGQGSLLVSGRWHTAGNRVLYASLSLACAMIETLVRARIGRFPRNHVYVELRVPAGLACEELREGELAGWDRADGAAARAFGDAWYSAGSSPLLIVPSVVSRKDRNLVVNLNHPDSAKIAFSRPASVPWDQRLEERFKKKAPARRR